MGNKTPKQLKVHALFTSLSCCFLLNTACVNEIKPDIQAGSVPITFSVKVAELMTKVSDNEFEAGDKVGLYAMISGEKIDGQRYIDNLALVCTEGNKLVPEKNVFYPEGDMTLDFISYYPYRQEAVAEGNPTISIEVQTDQSDQAAYSQSDFMTASCDNVASSPDAVELGYRHQLTKLKISLSPESDEDLKEMIESDPKIIAIGFYTQADFDLQDNNISNLKNKADIAAAGTWTKDDDRLSGKEFIIIPQDIDSGQKFQMEWNGRIYDCPMPDMEGLDDLKPNTQYELVINVSSANNNILNGVVANIIDWPDEVVLDNVEGEEGSMGLHLSVLSFEKSNIYQVHLGGIPIMDICKEYLISNKLTSTAITAYPLDKNGNADLTNGTILQLYDVDETINGGTISWNTEKNTFTYTEGSLPPVTEIYFDTSGKMYTEKPDDPAKVNIIASTIRDFRGGSTIQEYAIVKIGTQYWMRENLRATKYRDGSDIDKQDVLDGTPGYFYASSNDSYFYSGEVLLESKTVAPDDWEIPSMDDWDVLDKYIDGDVSLLKAGEWEALSSSSDLTVTEVNNRTMFYLYPLGQWANDDENNNHINAGKAVGFWSWDKENNEIPEETVFFKGEDNERVLSATRRTSNKEHYKGICIRCIKQAQ